MLTTLKTATNASFKACSQHIHQLLIKVYHNSIVVIRLFSGKLFEKNADYMTTGFQRRVQRSQQQYAMLTTA
jgi:hypothetical protein